MKNSILTYQVNQLRAGNFKSQYKLTKVQKDSRYLLDMAYFVLQQLKDIDNPLILIIRNIQLDSDQPRFNLMHDINKIKAQKQKKSDNFDGIKSRDVQPQIQYSWTNSLDSNLHACQSIFSTDYEGLLTMISMKAQRNTSLPHFKSL